MVSKASDDLPDPLNPVITVSVLRGISTEMFFKLCWRAPRTVMLLIAMDLYQSGSGQLQIPPQNTLGLVQSGPGGSIHSSTPYLTVGMLGRSISDSNSAINLSRFSYLRPYHDQRPWQVSRVQQRE